MAHIAMVVTNACAPDPRVERHARWLVESGHSVTIYAWDRKSSFPKNDIKNGYKITRFRHGVIQHNKPIKTWFIKKKFLQKLTINSDILILNDTDTNRVNFKGKILLDIHDLAHTWPVMMSKSVLHRIASKLMLGEAKRAIKRADSVIVSAPGFKRFVGKFGKDAEVVMNKIASKSIDVCERKVVGYFGRIREVESIVSAYEAAKIAGFEFVLAGDGSDVDAVLDQISDIDYRGSFDENQYEKLLHEISVMYAMYDPSRPNIMEGAIPTKMLDAAAYGIPTVVNDDTPMGDYCLENNLGTTAPYGNKKEIAKSIKNAHNMKVRTIQSDDREIFLSVINKLI